MKKLLFIPILFAGVIFASEYKYEITPIVGYNLTEGNIGLKDYGIVGGELQYNGLNSAISPELSILYSKADYTANSNKDSKVYRVALSGVYDFEQMGPVVPLVKAGIGYEDIKESYKGNSPFIDLGVGAKIPFNETIALKFEALYMLNYNDAVDHNRKDSNLALLAGINIAFGEKAKVEAPEPNVNEVMIENDDDKDGVPNSQDKCPSTKRGESVNTDGCFIDGDDDKDGVLNSKDKCKDTPLGKLVYNDGCPESLNLNVNFTNDSAVISQSSHERIKSYAKFLRENTNYSTDIIGYTSNTGSDIHNQKLSEKRAISVQKMIINEGVPASKVRAEGRGSLNPIASNDTAEGRAANRRIEAEITKDR